MPADCSIPAVTEEEIPYHTRYYRKRGRPLMKEKAQSQQYLSPPEEKALVAFILRLSAVDTPIRIKYNLYLRWPFALRADVLRIDPLSHQRRIGFRPSVAATPRSNRGSTGLCCGSVIYDKVVHWFNVIKEELCRSVVLPENVYNMDETGIMLSILGSVKVLVGKDDRRDYRGTGTKRTMVTAIECVSASGEYLNPVSRCGPE